MSWYEYDSTFSRFRSCSDWGVVFMQYCMYGAFGLWAILLFGVIVASVRAGNPVYPTIAVFMASPMLLAGLAVFLEDRNLGALANLKNGSWSFLIGDTLVLTSATVFAALAWRSIPHEGWIVSRWWTVGSALIGLLAGAAFHYWDGKGYIAAGASNRLLSPTKIAHDFVACPVLFGALVCIGIPLLLNWSWHTWAVLVCVGVWLALVACDGLRGLNVFELHPGWNPILFEVVPDAAPPPPPLR